MARKLPKWLMYVLFSMGAVILIVETTSHFILTRWVSEEQLQYYGSKRQIFSVPHKNWYTPHRFLGFSLTPHYNQKHNSFGFRGPEIEIPKPPEMFRIACLGASTTYSTSVAQDETYPAQLEVVLHEYG